MKIFKIICIILVLAFSAYGCSSQPMNAERIISAFKKAGLEAEGVRPMNQSDYGAAPQLCNGTRFFIPSLGPNNGGRIFICDKQDERDALTNYYNGLAAQGSIYVSWVFVKGNVIVQINGQLTNEIAKKYEAAIP